VKGQSVVAPVEDWQMSDIEVALASFLARHDYRDYYQRKGGNAFITLYGARNISLTGSYGENRWSSRAAHNPVSLFNQSRDWRPNPRMDEGLFHVGDLAFTLDTRSDPEDPSAGWFVNTNVEHGSGDVSSMAPTSTPRADLTGSVTDYTRGFFDFRRYNRLGPAAQLNMRVVLGGWLGGDALPLERRLSVAGPGSLPGFGFRGDESGPDIGTCSVGLTVSGQPAECERIALAQLEYRGDLSFDFASNWANWPRRYHSAHGDVQWVFFADAGRGWNVGPGDGAMTFNSATLPSLSSFRTDLGIGLDFAGIGIYAAKAVSRPEPVNFFVRLRHRF
jgi:outer membrane protein assembly factor BamA